MENLRIECEVLHHLLAIMPVLAGRVELYCQHRIVFAKKINEIASGKSDACVVGIGDE